MGDKVDWNGKYTTEELRERSRQAAARDKYRPSRFALEVVDSGIWGTDYAPKLCPDTRVLRYKARRLL